MENKRQELIEFFKFLDRNCYTECWCDELIEKAVDEYLKEVENENHLSKFVKEKEKD